MSKGLNKTFVYKMNNCELTIARRTCKSLIQNPSQHVNSQSSFEGTVQMAQVKEPFEI